MKKLNLNFIVLAALSFLLLACEDTPIPKPLGYFRIDFPDKKYLSYEGNCPYRFEYPFRSLLDTNLRGRPACWMNLHYPQYSATVHFTYNAIDSENLARYIEDSRKLAMKHIVKANNIEEELIRRNDERVYGLCYDFGGSTATNFQFFLTDSNKHFLRGSMYFNLPPNPDSLEPVSAYIKKDIMHLIHSLEWQEE